MTVLHKRVKGLYEDKKKVKRICDSPAVSNAYVWRRTKPEKEQLGSYKIREEYNGLRTWLLQVNFLFSCVGLYTPENVYTVFSKFFKRLNKFVIFTNHEFVMRIAVDRCVTICLAIAIRIRCLQCLPIRKSVFSEYVLHVAVCICKLLCISV